MLQRFNISFIIHKVVIPLEPTLDQMLWIHTDSGNLQLRDAYFFKSQQFQDLHWAKVIWSPDIPPSKYLFVWRLMHDKVPTDEHLLKRGCHLPSMCNLCCKKSESSFHIFFQCEFAILLWSWLASFLNLNLQFNSMEDIWNITDRNWSPQYKETITAAIINLTNTIWSARNQVRFNNKRISLPTAISLIIANTCLFGNNTTKVVSNSIRDFSILEFFKINIDNQNSPSVKEILWQPPLFNWVKCNIDGASKGNPGCSSCGGIFRNHAADFMLCFAEPICFASSYLAE
jgi:hypothetical protein